MNLRHYIEAHRDWSARTFGPATPENDRTQGVIEHIRKELLEVAAAPHDPEEWADVIILAIDGAWRNGVGPMALCNMLEAKQAKNMDRIWPDWHTTDPTKATEHDRSTE